MDKTFNDLVDIVHRTKKIGGNVDNKLTSTGLRKRVSNSEVVEHDIVENVGSKGKAGLKGASAISSFLEKGKTTKKTKKAEPKQEKAPAKKTATKSTAKKSTKTTTKTTAKTATKKTVTKTPIKKKVSIQELAEKENTKKALVTKKKEKESKIKDLVGSLKNKTKKIAPNDQLSFATTFLSIVVTAKP